MRLSQIFLLSTLLLAGGLRAQHPLPTRSVSVFKNGTAFLIRSGQVSPTDGHFRLKAEDLPPALFGTIWLSSPDKNLGAVSTFVDTVSNEVMATDYFLSAKENIGKRVSLHLGEKGEEKVSGVIRDAQDGMIAIEGEGQWLLVPVKDIHRLSYLERPNWQMTRKQAERVMQINFVTPKPKQTVDLMYLRTGIAWFPQYRIDLVGEDKAMLSFRAELANDAEDIENSEVNFVVGIPNFQFTNQTDPLFYFGAMNQYLNGFATGNVRSGYAQSRADMAQTMSNAISYETASDQFAGLPAPADNVEGESQEDLYYYSIHGVTLPKGGRAMYTVFSREIEVEHIYEAQLPANAAYNEYYQTSAQTLPDPVFHRLKLLNNSNQPFTTGSAMVFRADGPVARPISQDKLTYTPPGGRSFITLTNASDVEVRHKENEVARVVNAKRENKIQYDLVTVEGEITIKNHKSTDLRLDIRRTLTGELLSTKPDWQLSRRVNFNSSLNPLTDVCWELKPKAGEEITIRYSYKIFVQ